MGFASFFFVWAVFYVRIYITDTYGCGLCACFLSSLFLSGLARIYVYSFLFMILSRSTFSISSSFFWLCSCGFIFPLSYTYLFAISFCLVSWKRHVKYLVYRLIYSFFLEGMIIWAMGILLSSYFASNTLYWLVHCYHDSANGYARNVWHACLRLFSLISLLGIPVVYFITVQSFFRRTTWCALDTRWCPLAASLAATSSNWSVHVFCYYSMSSKQRV
ncbi:hypothetical protein BJ508DRAFT_152101 [Ascobolus immersus RN42]|uniref:Uncharacterized protein n=1 Tax=Ascobolus immersus RN42 TaxID=1160509 RepID=A0A3N4I028_ASCIM|nr:hypothetical protein BJ508DRAFT_152101 [Ascobolus immersus RN42]